MQSHIEEIRAADAQILAICVDSVEKNSKVVEKLNLDFPILSDSELKAIKAFGLLDKDAGSPSGPVDLARPAVFIIDQQGVVQWRALTENWRVRIRGETVLQQLSMLP